MAQQDEEGEARADAGARRGEPEPMDTGPDGTFRAGEAGARGRAGNGGGRREPRRLAGEFAGRMESRLNGTFGAAASRLAEASGRLDRLADRRTAADGAGGFGSVTRSVAGLFDTTAELLRNSDIDRVRSALRREMRERPLRTLFIGVAAGWLLGKILR